MKKLTVFVVLSFVSVQAQAQVTPVFVDPIRCNNGNYDEHLVAKFSGPGVEALGLKAVLLCDGSFEEPTLVVREFNSTPIEVSATEIIDRSATENLIPITSKAINGVSGKLVKTANGWVVQLFDSSKNKSLVVQTLPVSVN